MTDNGNGTVTDNLTGLIWLKNANCFGTRDWATALSYANALASGSIAASAMARVAGDWRLPNVRELQSLIDYGRSEPGAAERPSFHRRPVASSTTGRVPPTAGRTSIAWSVRLYDGTVISSAKPYTFYVWPVRGGQ